MCRLYWNLEASNSWNPQGLSRPVVGLLYLWCNSTRSVVLTSSWGDLSLNMEWVQIYGRSEILHNLCAHMLVYTGCNRRNGPDFGRVFLMLNYTEKTPKHLYPKFNDYGDIGQRKVWTSLVSTYCTLSVSHTRRIWGMGPVYYNCIPTLSLEAAERPWLS